MRTRNKWELYFFEVCIGEQTAIFHPTDYIDISATQEQKRKAVYCHTSQDPPGIYACGHSSMEDFRGREMGVKAAEGFVRMNGKGLGGFSVVFVMKLCLELPKNLHSPVANLLSFYFPG